MKPIQTLFVFLTLLSSVPALACLITDTELSTFEEAITKKAVAYSEINGGPFFIDPGTVKPPRCVYQKHDWRELWSPSEYLVFNTDSGSVSMQCWVGENDMQATCDSIAAEIWQGVEQARRQSRFLEYTPPFHRSTGTYSDQARMLTGEEQIAISAHGLP